jgi:hypothetical protein
VVLLKGMLFVELANAKNGWLWHSDMIRSNPELELGYFGRLLVGRAKGRIENIVGGGEPIAWCD